MINVINVNADSIVISVKSVGAKYELQPGDIEVSSYTQYKVGDTYQPEANND